MMDERRDDRPDDRRDDRRDDRGDDAQRVSPRLLEALVCPATGGRLEYDATRGEMISRTAMLAYPIRSGIPIMLIDEARKLDG
jgi:uncharacterized protein YbaR (Trm112 family)